MESSARAARTADPALLAPRWVRLLRAGLLCAVGVAVTFSATLHEDIGFDLALLTAALALLGAVHLIEWTQRRGRAGAPVALLLGIASIAAAVLIFSIHGELGMALVLAAWSLACALLELLGSTIVPGSRPDGVLVGVVGILLALALVLVRDDAVAVIGFFGGYAVLTGVFLGIAAFDRRTSASDDARPQSSPASFDHVESEQ